MAHKKGVGSTDNGRDSISKRLGVKLFGGQKAKAGNIIIRQRGTKYHAGENTYLGKDFTIHARVAGYVKFDKRRHNRTFVSIVPLEQVEETLATNVKENREAAPLQTFAKNKPVAKAAPAKATAQAAKATPVAKAPEVAKPAATPAQPKATAQPSKPVKATPVAKTPAAPAQPKATAQPSEPAKATPVAKTPATPASGTAERITLPSGKRIKMNDLKVIEGVGPKIAGLLNEAGIQTWQDLSAATPEQIKAILTEAGPQYNIFNPTSWPKQAAMAVAGSWEELEKYQDHLQGGVDPDA